MTRSPGRRSRSRTATRTRRGRRSCRSAPGRDVLVRDLAPRPRDRSDGAAVHEVAVLIEGEVELIEEDGVRKFWAIYKEP
jgi:hypothetical protein